MGKVYTFFLYVLLTILFFGQLVFAQSHFSFNTTEDYYSIVVNTVTLDGQSIQIGDEIGVFFNDNGTMICAGAVEWPINGINVWGDDSQTIEKDGFALGDSLIFQVWDASDSKEYYTSCQYTNGDGTWGDGLYAQVILNTTFSTGINSFKVNCPDEFILKQNFPNPFNPQTVIEFSVPKTEHIVVEVFNVMGQKIRLLLDEKKNPGLYQLVWDGKDDNQAHVVAGTYLLRIKAADFTQTIKMSFVK